MRHRSIDADVWYKRTLRGLVPRSGKACKLQSKPCRVSELYSIH